MFTTSQSPAKFTWMEQPNQGKSDDDYHPIIMSLVIDVGNKMEYSSMIVSPIPDIAKIERICLDHSNSTAFNMLFPCNFPEGCSINHLLAMSALLLQTANLAFSFTTCRGVASMKDW